MQMERMDILAEIDEAVYMLKERALSEGKHLLYDDPEEMPIIYGDRNRLKQVFLNIIDNALKYTPEGGMIGVQVYQDYKEHTIKVVVADNGCGINAEDLPKVKDKFYKATRGRYHRHHHHPDLQRSRGAGRRQPAARRDESLSLPLEGKVGFSALAEKVG